MNYLIKSIITKKSISIEKSKNVYTFLFHNKANKLNIKKNIEKRYNVSVKNIRTMILLLKKKSKKKSFPTSKKYIKIKKVLIELKNYQHIEV